MREATMRFTRGCRRAGLGIWLGIGLLPAAGAAAQEAAPAAGPARLPAADLAADVDVLERAYRALHPGLWRYNTREQIDAAFAELRRELGRDQTRAQAYLALSVFLAKLRCGHTYANFFNQPREVAAELFDGSPRVPFFFRLLGRRMIVTRSFAADPRLAPGSEVVALAGRPVGEILDRLLTVARADGSNDAKRLASLEVRGDARYEAFDVFYPLFFPPGDGPLELQVRPPSGGAAVALAVPWATAADRRAAAQALEAAVHGDGPLWDLRFEGRLAVLRMPSWVTYNSRWDWQAFLRQAFGEIARRHATALVIDLRGNEGGSSVGNVLLAHLTRRQIHLSSYRRFVRYRKVPDDLIPYLDTWDPSFRDWGEAAVPAENGFFRLTRFDDDAKGDVIRPASPAFRGRTFVLVDASNSSATFEFALAVREHRLATLVGQPPGGNQRGLNGGAFFFLRLPHSKLETDLPLIALFPEKERPDAGIEPDLPVMPTARDIARGLDPELAAVRRALQGR